jgi:hypothetical protein
LRLDSSSPYLLSNLSLVSCIPSFWKSTSRVSVLPSADTLGQPGQIVDIVLDNSSVERIWPEFWDVWVKDIPQHRVEDPTTPIQGDDLGGLVYSYANQANRIVNLAQSMNTTFSVLFAAFATTSTYSPLAENLTFTRTPSRPANRLFVVFLPVTIVTTVMAIFFVVTIWIAVYAYQNNFILKLHSDLILGHAILLKDNGGLD